MSGPRVMAPPPRPDWSADELLKPWRRGRPPALPFATAERSEADTRKRMLLVAGITGLVVSLSTFAVLVWAGLFPEIHHDPRITQTGDRSVLPWVVLGCGAAAAVVLLALLFPFLAASPPGSGHPYAFEATEAGFTITNARGEVFAGPWSAWTLAGYDTLHIPRAGPALAVLYLSLDGREHPVRLMDLKRQRAFLRLVAQRVAV